MKLVTAWFGTFLLDDDFRILDKSIFPADPEEVAARLGAMERGEVLAEEEALASGKRVLVREKRLAALGDVIDFPQPDLRPERYGADSSLLGKAMLAKGREKVRASTKPDEHIVQAIRSIDDLTRIVNLMSERLHEWHALNFPELAALVPEARYVELIAEFGDRKSMVDAGAVAMAGSMGVEASQADAAAMKSLAGNILAVLKEKKDIEQYIEKRMREIAPNLTHLAGPLIGARLISLTGGMDRLAMLPSSTIQLLGAEKALFKHLKENARPPKHGVIFQHPIIHRAPPWQRGKIARAFAAKLAVAARIDRHGGKFAGPELEAALSKRVEEIKRKHPGPKPRTHKPSHRKGAGRR
jgi:nucleolar protein 56